MVEHSDSVVVIINLVVMLDFLTVVYAIFVIVVFVAALIGAVAFAFSIHWSLGILAFILAFGIPGSR